MYVIGNWEVDTCYTAEKLLMSSANLLSAFPKGILLLSRKMDKAVKVTSPLFSIFVMLLDEVSCAEKAE
jgi:hypothetical protein